MCEVLFAAGWRWIGVFEVVCRGGCSGVSGRLVRDALMRLVAARPGAHVRVVMGWARVWRRWRRLACWRRCGRIIDFVSRFL